MEGDSRDTTVMIVIIFVVLLVALGAIFFTAYQIFRQTGGFFPKDETRSEIPFVLIQPPKNAEPTPYVVEDLGDFDFAIGEDSYYIKVNDETKYNYSFAISQIGIPENYDVNIGEKDEGFVDEVRDRQEEFDQVVFGDLAEVQVPRIGVKSPVLQGTNGDELLDHGWWLYPGSYTSESGEKILYCHRRYFGRFDPRTCWNMNQVIEGDEILLFNTQGQQFTYKVISTSVVYQDTTNLMRPSTKDYVKIVTCGAENGAPGGNDWRVVILGELVK